jgi:hypothetical protein
VGLYELLHRVAPDNVLTPIATDLTRGWIVLPDGGRSLGERLTGTELIDALMAVLPQYGQLQRDLAPYADRLLALGVADMRPAIMPRRFEEALEAMGAYVERSGAAAARATFEEVASLRESVISWCDRLAASPASASVDHNDRHPWNVFVGGTDGVGHARFYDWGDCVVAHRSRACSWRSDLRRATSSTWASTARRSCA